MLEVISCLFRRALLYSPASCKTVFSTKFRTKKLKADGSSVFFIFISINQ